MIEVGSPQNLGCRRMECFGEGGREASRSVKAMNVSNVAERRSRLRRVGSCETGA